MDFDPKFFPPTGQQEVTQEGLELFNIPFSQYAQKFIHRAALTTLLIQIAFHNLQGCLMYNNQ